MIRGFAVNVHRAFLTSFFLMLRMFLSNVVLAFLVMLEARAQRLVSLLVQLLDIRTFV